MGKQSERWKALERETAKALGGNRVLRGADYSESAPDVELEDFPWLKIDCKAYRRFSHHTLLQDVREKYCREQPDEPVLVTKHHRQHGANVTITLEFFRELLSGWTENIGGELRGHSDDRQQRD